MDYATLKTELQKPEYVGLSNAQAAAALLVESETVETPRVLAESGFFALIAAGKLSLESFGKVFDHPTFSLFKADIANQNHAGVAIWASAFAARGLITADEATEFVTYATGLDTATRSPAERIGWAEVTEHDVAHARSLK